MLQGKAKASPSVAASVVDVKLTAYQMTLAGLRLPFWAHIAFNILFAAGVLLLGHPLVAASMFLSASAFDFVQQKILASWLTRSAGADEAAGFRRLAALCATRVSLYTTPTFIMTLHGGLPEFASYGIQLASLLVVALGAGAMSRTVFWALSGPLVLQVAALAFLMFSPLAGASILIGLAILLILMTTVSESTVRAITQWHAAFLDNIAMVDDLAAARDQAVAERTAADEAREAARTATRAKSNFLATMSHEIRTPMNGVLGMAQLLKRDETDPGQSARLDVLIDSGEYLLSILNDILDVSKIDAGKLEIITAPEDLRPFLDRLVGFWAARAEEKGVALDLQVGLDLPERVMVDSLRLRQILFNLVGNALKFTEAGSVTIIADAAHQGDGLVDLHIAVRDTGPGIAAHHLPHLFDRFSQVDETEMRKFGGTGLGLAIVKQLVGLMGGRVWVESTPGKGSIFHVEAPLQALQPGVTDAGEDACPDAAEIQPLKILAVDDNAVNLLVLEQLLSSLDHEVAKASSGAAALEALAAQSFDLILTDIQMPQMTGTELLQHLRERPGPNRRAPVIALTADVTSGGRQRYLDQGFDEHASKPIQLEELLDAMARALDPPSEAAAQVA